jgi:hypothetical protein
MQAIEEIRLRTEDLKRDEILGLFVPTFTDREIVRLLKAASPVILEGSRGTGKSFLLRVAEIELENSFPENRVMPVYVSFIRSSLVHTPDPQQFQHWMLAKICNRVVRALKGHGFTSGFESTILSGSVQPGQEPTPLEMLEVEFEESYKNPDKPIRTQAIPTVEQFKDAIEDICEKNNIARISLLFDEAIHIFRPEQQRQFFTLFRDLRSAYIGCNAAVYPGVTSYGDVFELAHDATLKRLERDMLSAQYVDNMREIALKQVESGTAAAILRNESTFTVLAYCVGGNPRLLLKNLSQCPELRAPDVNELVKSFYRSGIWSEHSSLAETYSGHKPLIDWGRNFIEAEVLPRLGERSQRAIREPEAESSCFFWVNRDAPEPVKHALRLLAYTGIVQKGEDAIRGTRAELGTRYTVNFGCVLATQANPTTVGTELARKLSVKRFVEFGANHPSYAPIRDATVHVEGENMLQVLREQLARPINELDLTDWQKSHLQEIGFATVGQLLKSDESVFVERLRYVGPKRARRIKNAADAAVLEYLSG